MKYIKEVNNFKSKIENFKFLLSHFIKIFSNYGLDYSTSSEFSCIETEFRINGVYTCSIRFDKYDSFFTIRESISGDNFTDFIVEYLQSIKGLKYLGYVSHHHDFEIKTSVEDIINEITIEDFELKYNADKYNL
jgi:hypothetical protein